MSNSKEMHEAIERAFKELMNFSDEDLSRLLDEPLGSVGFIMDKLSNQLENDEV